MLDKKSPGVHQPQPRTLQWNANGIHRELPLLEDLIDFHGRCVHPRDEAAAKRQDSETPVLSDVKDQCKGKRDGEAE